ncbi:MAG: HPr(Ser) kinase/phosphatase [Granulosicoccaceae bacterium]|jgi:HPr kinase/phosphorylase
MATQISVKELFDTYRKKLALTHVCGNPGDDRYIQYETAQRDETEVPDVSFVGHLNFIHPHRIQVLGKGEMEYLDSLDYRERNSALNNLFAGNPLCIVFTGNIETPDDFIALSQNTGIPIFSSPHGSQMLVNNLQYYISYSLANRTTLHGVFLEVSGIGVLLTGESSVGKSELALELVTRGHRLIADDAPEFARIAPDIVSGSCPPAIKHFLEVRGLGVLNIQAMFGDSAIKESKYLRLIVNLQKMSDQQLQQIDRLRGIHKIRSILGVEVEQVTLPVAPGRNLAVLVEVAVRNHILALKGYNAAEAFVARQTQYIQKNSNK